MDLNKIFEYTEYTGKQRITTWDQIEVGNHIAWNRGLYEHHAIVESVKPTERKVRVIEYGGGDSVQYLKTDDARVQTRDETIENFTDVHLYRCDYDPKVCFPPEEVVKRAKGREGERGYNLVFQNCEHFATWCKTGKAFSRQVDDVEDALDQGPTYVAAKQLARSVIDYTIPNAEQRGPAYAVANLLLRTQRRETESSTDQTSSSTLFSTIGKLFQGQRNG